MATKKRTKSTLAKVGASVKGAAKTVAEKTDEYVVTPVGKALGLTGKKKPVRRSAAKKTAARKPAAKKTTPRKRTTKARS